MSQFNLEILDEYLKKSIVHEFKIQSVNDSNIKLFVKRDDLIHSEFSGNKLRKLKYNLKSCFDNQCEGILTFGGAFSNHLLAVASACNLLNLKSVGVVRGEELNKYSNGLISRCAALGMELLFVTRYEYFTRKKATGRIDFRGSSFWSVPEGGANSEGIIGSQEIVSNLDFDYVVVAQGTSTTSLGIALNLKDWQKLIVVPVLKGFDALGEMKNLLRDDEKFSKVQHKIIVLDDFHFGGYAKGTNELNLFIEEFNSLNNFRIEPIYTGKAMYALKEFIESNKFIENKKVLFVHTGGLNNYSE